MLEIKKLKATYGNDSGNDSVLNGVDLELGWGETLAVIGESGTGKTTLALSIMRLTEAALEGAICFQGRDLLQLEDEQMRGLRWKRIALVFQNAGNVLNPLYTVLDQLIEPMVRHMPYSREEARGRAVSLCAQLGLPEHLLSRYPHELSSGEEQRVLLALGLAGNPELLLLDEPLSSLDVNSRADIVRRLQGMLKGRSCLIFTHDLDTAAQLAHRIAVLYAGKIMEVGPARELLSRPRHPYTRALIRSYPHMNASKELQGIKGRLARPVAGCPFHPRCTQVLEVCTGITPELTTVDGRLLACHRGGIVTLLATRNLSKAFTSRMVVKSVNLHVESGETLALVGQSGSGKTTLAKLIMGLYPASSGTVFWEGAQLETRGKGFYRRMQMVFQSPGDSLSHRLSILEAVREPLDIHRVGSGQGRNSRVMQVLGEVGLPQDEDFWRRYPHQLSGGELQRVAIARALVLDPQLLIADEPTTFLDPSVQAKILKLLLQLQEERGLSMLFITHDIAVAGKVADRIAVMLEGEIIEEGPSHKILTQPRQDYTRQLVSSASALEELTKG